MDRELEKYPALLNLAREMLSLDAPIEEVLERLREESPSIIQSIKVVRDVLDLPLGQAKDLVHFSRTWSDMRDPISELHEQAEAAAPSEPVQNLDGSYRIELDLRNRARPDS
jgi:hypothetical protein